MKILGVPIPFTKANPALQPVTASNRGWYRIMESYAGAWQQNVEIDQNAVLSYNAVFACMTLIASDMAKLRIKLVQQQKDFGIWKEIRNPAYSPVLRKPNHFQNRIQFIEQWVLSKLSNGNAYILKETDGRSVVTAMYMLDPRRVTPLVTPTGEVYYRLSADYLSQLNVDTEVIVPASAIIHDRFNCIYHPLVGVSPIFAAGVAATQGLRIQENSAVFFGNRSTPGGILVAPGEISEASAAELKTYWNTNFTGSNAGKIAVIGDGMKFEKLGVDAKDAEMIAQLKWTAEVVCSVFHVPPYKIGLTQPTYNNVQALNTEYYSQCLQTLIEAAELCLDEGLGIGDKIGTEFDIENLLRMDSTSQIAFLKEAVGAGIMSPDEARMKIDLNTVTGGATPYLQQQNYSLAALAKRDAKDDPFETAGKAPGAENDNAAQAAAAERALKRSLSRWGRSASKKYSRGND